MNQTKPKRYEVLFVDYDDTLSDTYKNSKAAMESLFKDSILISLYPDFEQFFDQFIKLNLHLWEKYHHAQITKEELLLTRFLSHLQTKGVDDPNLALHLNKEYLSRVAEETVLIPYAQELLDYLAPRYRMVLLTNGFREVQEKKVRNSGVMDYFEQIILSDDVGVNKPHPDIFHYALRSANAPKEKTLMIGDNFNADIVGAKGVDIDQLFFNLHKRTNLPFVPTYTIDHLKQAEGIL